MTTRTLTVPGEPVAKGRPRFTKDGHAYTPEKTRTAEETIADHWVASFGKHPVSGPVRCEMRVYKPGGKRSEWPVTKPDWDNFGKMTDALNGLAWIDDKQVVDGRVRKLVGEARTEIEVEELE